jgi:hypothetical protein
VDLPLLLGELVADEKHELLTIETVDEKFAN